MLSDGSRAPVADASSDAVFSVQVFQHFESHADAIGVFADILRLLRPGGTLMIHLPLFPLKHVEVKGDLRHVTYQQVSYIVTREFKGNFFTLDLAQVGKGFQKLPWVRNVSLRRQWPDTLEVMLEEHAVLARWSAERRIGDAMPQSAA